MSRRRRIFPRKGVFSALEDVTTVFGMGTGRTPPLQTPGQVIRTQSTHQKPHAPREEITNPKSQSPNKFEITNSKSKNGVFGALNLIIIWLLVLGA